MHISMYIFIVFVKPTVLYLVAVIFEIILQAAITVAKACREFPQAIVSIGVFIIMMTHIFNTL